MRTHPSAWPGTRVLVTGASGFIGAHLVRKLTELGTEVHAVSRREQPAGPGRVQWHVADLGDADETAKVVASAQPEVVFHLASEATGARDPGVVLPTMRSNLTSVVHLLAALSDAPPRHVVLAGSVEERATDGGSPYVVAKRAAAAYARLYHQLWALPVTVLRIAMVYGPGQPDASKLVPYAIRMLLDGVPPELSSGTRLIDWIYVDDVVGAFLAAAETPSSAGASVDIGSGQQVSIRDTVELIQTLTRPEVEPRYGERADRPFDDDQVSDPAEAERLLGWRPRVDLAEGLRRTVDWYAP